MKVHNETWLDRRIRELLEMYAMMGRDAPDKVWVWRELQAMERLRRVAQRIEIKRYAKETIH